MDNNASVFKAVFDSTPLNDGLYFFLQLVYRHYPEDQFHYILALAAKEKKTDEEIYKEAQKKLPEIKPLMAKFTYILPGLAKLKKEMATQVMQLLGERKLINGCLEIGIAGGCISSLGKKIKLKGHRYVMNDIKPATGIAGILERGSLFKRGSFLPLTWQTSSLAEIPDASLDIVACYNGLHDCPEELLPGFIATINRILRKEGIFILREHDVQTPLRETLVLFAHTVINLGSNIEWTENLNKVPRLMTVSSWGRIISAAGFEDSGARLVPDKDPIYNTLMRFEKL